MSTSRLATEAAGRLAAERAQARLAAATTDLEAAFNAYLDEHMTASAITTMQAMVARLDDDLEGALTAAQDRLLAIRRERIGMSVEISIWLASRRLERESS